MPRLTLGISYYSVFVVLDRDVLSSLVDVLLNGGNEFFVANLYVAALVPRNLAGFAGVKVILASTALKHFASLGDFKPFGNSLIRLHKCYFYNEGFQYI